MELPYSWPQQVIDLIFPESKPIFKKPEEISSQHAAISQK